MVVINVTLNVGELARFNCKYDLLIDDGNAEDVTWLKARVIIIFYARNDTQVVPINTRVLLGWKAVGFVGSEDPVCKHKKLSSINEHNPVRRSRNLSMHYFQ